MTILRRNNVQVLGSKGPPLIYGHGFGCSQRMWDQVTPAFASTHRQVLFDYVGCGGSDLSAFDVARYSSLHGYVRDLLEVCDALGLERGVTFVGHSVSCSVGLLASIARPGLFERMILVGPSPCFLNSPGYPGGFDKEDLEELLALMQQNYIGWANYLAPVVAGEAAGGTVARELSAAFCTTDPVSTRVFARTTFFADNREDLPHVATPCLILQHRHDAMASPEIGAYVHSRLSGSTLRVMDINGHCAHMSHPQLVVEAMSEYLNAPLSES
ncbi:MAG: alpha/beta hydrolase [Myxococcales bacterium]|nr:alpha/beta hydrolase [Myxococcales bacterium]MDP3506252.1 alpha/beta hydrolase [Myxococcales bacterium]